MTTPQRPWWKRKHWIAAGVLWLLLSYPLSYPFLWYCQGRHWGPKEAVLHPVWWPIGRAVNYALVEEPPDAPYWVSYPCVVVRKYWDIVVWCKLTGVSHRTGQDLTRC